VEFRRVCGAVGITEALSEFEQAASPRTRTTDARPIVMRLTSLERYAMTQAPEKRVVRRVTEHQKATSPTMKCRNRWRLGWHGGNPL
jgi:hypothetical protein